MNFPIDNTSLSQTNTQILGFTDTITYNINDGIMFYTGSNLLQERIRINS